MSNNNANTTGNTIVENAVKNATSTQRPRIIAGKFAGAFSGFQDSAFLDLKSFGFTPELAHKIASDFGSDIARSFKEDAELKAKVNKAKDDGETRFKFSGKSGTVKMSNAMSTVRVCQVLESLKGEQLLKVRKFPRDEVKTEIAEYLTESEKWVSEQSWNNE